MTAKTKKLTIITGGILALAMVLVIGACSNDALPQGDLVPGPGRPGGGVLGGGGGGGGFPIFNINNMPPVSFWNNNGPIYHLPDLFTFAGGRTVATLDDWFGEQGRRWEIGQIIQQYWHGFMPHFGDRLDVSWTEVGPTLLTIHMTYTHLAGTTTTQDFNVNVNIPAGIPEGESIPAVINIAGGTVAFQAVRDGHASTAGQPWASIGFNRAAIAGENMGRTGVVANLFGFDYNTNPYAPSALMGHAWFVGRIIDALETEQYVEGEGYRLPYHGRIDPTRLMATGMSRDGKSAVIVGAFAESKRGTQIAVTRIGSAGAGGPAIERSLGPIGIHERYTLTVDEALPLNNKPGRTFYFEFLGGDMGNRLLPSGTAGGGGWFVHRDIPTEVPYLEGIHGPVGDDLTRVSGGHPIAVRAISPEEFRRRRMDPELRYTVFKYDFFPREGIFNNNFWTGIQNMAQARNEVRAWFSENFRNFADLHFGLRVDEVAGIPVRTPDGFLSTIPFDAHFALAMIAPRAIVINEGFRTVRNTPEGTFLAHLAVDEVFRFMEEQGMTADDIPGAGFPSSMNIQDFNTIEMHFIPHSDPNYQQLSSLYIADVFFGRISESAVPGDFQDRFRSELFPIYDARSKNDFSRLNWARPGAPSLRDRIAHVPDYPWQAMNMTRWTGFINDPAFSDSPWFDASYPWSWTP